MDCDKECGYSCPKACAKHPCHGKSCEDCTIMSDCVNVEKEPGAANG